MFALWRLWRRVGGWRALLAQVMLAWRLAKDPRVPAHVKLILPAPVLYFFTPINLLFEWIPFVGQIDDLGVLMLAIGAFLKACPQHVVAEHAARLENEMRDERTFDRIGRFGQVGKYVRPSFRQWSERVDRVTQVDGAPANQPGQTAHPRSARGPADSDWPGAASSGGNGARAA